MSDTTTPTASPSPSPEALNELLDAERTRALQAITPPWPHFLLSVVCAAAVWLPDTGTARTVAVLSVVAPGVWILLRQGALVREGTVYATEDPGDGPADPVLASRVASRMLAVTNVVVSAVLAAVVLLVPLGVLRFVLPALCLWYVVGTVRQSRERRRAEAVVERAKTEPWYPAYRKRIDARRALLG
ncbi:hypothetical protein ABZ615_15955 [Streptomyces sp. NPDC007325]|uniref:hypothetical protein n=1 Tax=Streptomyces sp. NPDC007325 TaxID=3154588 RepID=UPI0033C181B6